MNEKILSDLLLHELTHIETQLKADLEYIKTKEAVQHKF